MVTMLRDRARRASRMDPYCQANRLALNNVDARRSRAVEPTQAGSALPDRRRRVPRPHARPRARLQPPGPGKQKPTAMVNMRGYEWLEAKTVPISLVA